MTTYEYSVIPAPKRGLKGRGIKGGEAQFANALTQLMNQAAAEGWHYLRAETLPSEERQGLTGRTTVYQNMLVFRRSVATNTDDAGTQAVATLPVENSTDENGVEAKAEALDLADETAQTENSDETPLPLEEPTLPDADQTVEESQKPSL